MQETLSWYSKKKYPVKLMSLENYGVTAVCTQFTAWQLAPKDFPFNLSSESADGFQALGLIGKSFS